MASTKAFYLTEDDAVIWRRVVQYFRNMDSGVQNSASHLREIEDPSDDTTTPEVYIAEIPVAGIPALTIVDGKYIPGKATCRIHKLWPKGLVPGTGTGTGTGTDPGEFDEEEELIETHFDHIVHNLATTAIEGGPDLDTGTAGVSTGIFKVVWRDKFGRWVTEQSGAPGHVVIRFQVLSVGPFVGETSAYCLTILAEVLDVSCNGSGVAIGDEVVIWDPDSCQFNVPSDILIGMRGTAVKMAWGTTAAATGTGTGSVPLPGQDGGISECVDDLSSGTGWVAGECWWQVQTLCCGEDIYY